MRVGRASPLAVKGHHGSDDERSLWNRPSEWFLESLLKGPHHAIFFLVDPPHEPLSEPSASSRETATFANNEWLDSTGKAGRSQPANGGSGRHLHVRGAAH